nr:hypothetical protein [Xanthomonas maliensis]
MLPIEQEHLARSVDAPHQRAHHQIRIPIEVVVLAVEAGLALAITDVYVQPLLAATGRHHHVQLLADQGCGRLRVRIETQLHLRMLGGRAGRRADPERCQQHTARAAAAGAPPAPHTRRDAGIQPLQNDTSTGCRDHSTD